MSHCTGDLQHPYLSWALKTCSPAVLVCLSLLWLFATARPELRAAEPLNPDGISGTLILVGGGDVPKEVSQLLLQSVGDQPLVILPEASSNPAAAADAAKDWLSKLGLSRVTVVDASLPLPEQQQQTLAAIGTAKGVWVSGGQQSLLASSYAGTEIEGALRDLLQRGGVIAGTSAGAAIMSKVMIASGTQEPEISSGWNLLPGAIIDQHFTERHRLGRSQIAVKQHPHLFGLGIDEGTTVMITGRRMRIAGQGRVSVLLAETAYRTADVISLAAGETADLTQLRRAAEQRSRGIDPGQPTPGSPEVPQGSLVIVGGGGMPKAIVDRFIELAGGVNSKIVVLPTAVPREETTDQVPGFLKGDRVASVTVLPQRGTEVDSEEFCSALKSATGIWFGGGRQWHFVDAYEGTEAVQLFHDVLRRGGVIGGSSAGATIQGEFLVRGHPLGNTVMMAEGYERGFSFLPGVAIDQHFAQRGRQPDLLPVIRRHPEMLGIGIDEGTAIVVTGSKAEVLGENSAHFLPAKQMASLPPDAELPATAEDAAQLYISVKTGNAFDLKTLQPL